MHAVGHKKNSTTKESRDFSFFSLFQQNEKNDKKKGIRAQNKFNCEIFWQKAKTTRHNRKNEKREDDEYDDNGCSWKSLQRTQSWTASFSFKFFFRFSFHFLY